MLLLLRFAEGEMVGNLFITSVCKGGGTWFLFWWGLILGCFKGWGESWSFYWGGGGGAADIIFTIH